MIRKAMPAAKLTMLRNAIRIRKPARLSERCGVSIAENRVGSSSDGLPGFIGGQYSLNHGRKDDAFFAGEAERQKAGQENGEENGRAEASGGPTPGRQISRGQTSHQNQTLVRDRSSRSLRTISQSEPRTEGRARTHQPVYPAGRGRAVGAGHRRRRQQGDQESVPDRRYAGKDGRAW